MTTRTKQEQLQKQLQLQLEQQKQQQEQRQQQMLGFFPFGRLGVRMTGVVGKTYVGMG
jgi:hypothetical protein